MSTPNFRIVDKVHFSYERTSRINSNRYESLLAIPAKVFMVCLLNLINSHNKYLYTLIYYPCVM